MDLFEKCQGFTRAREVQREGIYPYFLPISGSDGTEVQIGDRVAVMAGSNNYLGLTHHPHVVEAAHRALARYGSSCTGSRFLNGTLDLHEELETRLAEFFRRDAALCFSTGFHTNLGVIGALCGKDDVVFCDRENHASIFDGCRQSFAAVRKFRHNDLEDLRHQLQMCERPDVRGKLIIVDGVFSMMGDIPDLPGIVALAREHNARVLVDEAHSVGVMGAHGRGVAEHFGLERDVDIVVGTFSKSFASLGGFVTGPEHVIHFIKHHARSLIFSASIPPTAAAAALAALDVIEREPERGAMVRSNAERVRSGLERIGFEVGKSQTPIVPIVVGEQERMLRFWRQLLDSGVYSNAVTVPAVPPGMDLIRTSYMATHTPSQLARILDVFERCGREMGLVPPSLREAR